MEHEIETERIRVACRRTRETPEQHKVCLKRRSIKIGEQRTLETPDDQAGRLEADRTRVSRQIAVETHCIGRQDRQK